MADGPKKRGEKIATSEFKYRRLFEGAKSGIFLIDPETEKIIDANPYLLGLIGYSLEETIGKKLWEVGTFRDIEEAKKVFEELQIMGYVRYEDLPLKTKAGGEIEVEFISNIYPIDNSRYMIQCSVRDITERKITEGKAELRLKESYERFHQIADNIDEVFFLSTRDYEILYLNPAFENIWGMPIESVLKNPKAWTDSILLEDREKFFAFFEDNLKKGNDFSYDYRIKKPNGDVRWIRTKTALVKDEKGNINRLSGIAFDITSIKEEAERGMALELLKSKFIQIVSHQMRTPLGAIRWNLEALLGGEMGGALSPEHQDVIRMIYNSNLSILDRLDDLLLSLDIENRVIKLELEKANLRSFIDSLIIEFGPLISLKKLKVSFHVPDAKYTVNIDVSKMKRAMSKILDNAIRYTNVGDEVKVILDVLDKDIFITVSDTGIGIPASDQERIFEKFFRSSNATAMYPDASGLGLFIAKNIIELHGGKIWFNSREGVGSDFYFKLPIAH